MYVCIFMHSACLHKYTYIHALCIYMHSACMYVCTYIVHVRMYVYIYIVHVRMYVGMYVHAVSKTVPVSLSLYIYPRHEEEQSPHSGDNSVRWS